MLNAECWDAGMLHCAAALHRCRYGLVVPPQSQVAVTDLMTNGILGKYSGTIDYAGAVDGLDVQLLKLTVVQ